MCCAVDDVEDRKDRWCGDWCVYSLYATLEREARDLVTECTVNMCTGVTAVSNGVLVISNKHLTLTLTLTPYNPIQFLHEEHMLHHFLRHRLLSLPTIKAFCKRSQPDGTVLIFRRNLALAECCWIHECYV
jgi:hypothetical protein